jgi:hypothetical protein
MGEVICPSAKATDLGVVLDRNITMNDHVKNLCAKAYYQLRLIRNYVRASNLVGFISGEESHKKVVFY